MTLCKRIDYNLRNSGWSAWNDDDIWEHNVHRDKISLPVEMENYLP